MKHRSEFVNDWIVPCVMIAVVLVVLWAMPAEAQTSRPVRPVGTPTSRIHRTVITPDGGRVNRYRWEQCRAQPLACPGIVAATPTPRPRRR